MIRKKILEWYDENRRDLPWRARPNQAPNPYYVYLSEVLLQQTTVTAVIPYFNEFITKWPTLEHFAKARQDDVLHTFQGLGYYSRARNLTKASALFYKNGGIPDNVKDLLLYPGLGDYTAKAVASIAFNKPVIPVDGNVIRVFTRYFGMEEPLPHVVKKVKEKALALENNDRPGDFAQALMDFGSMICKPKNPSCGICVVANTCQALKQNIVNVLPTRIKKKKIPTLFATAFLYIYKERILLIKNPSDGLLSNLWGVPTTPWVEWIPKVKKEEAHITHVFTHFHLTLAIEISLCKNMSDINIDAPEQFLVEENKLHTYAISSLMKKVLKKYKTISQSIVN